MKEVIIITKKGLIKRFELNEVRPMGRQASGVIAITLKEDDEVVGMEVIDKE